MQTRPTWRKSLLMACLFVLPLLYPTHTRANILWRNTASGANAIWYMNGTTVTSVALLPTGDPAWSIVGVGDFNADGKQDILWRNTASGANAIWYMNGTTVTSVALLPTGDPAWRIVGVGDFNADNKPDILWRNTSSGMNAVWYMNGATITSVALLPTGDPAWTIATTGDFNADGTPDLLWRNLSTGQNAVWYMNGATVTSVALLPDGDPAWKVVAFLPTVISGTVKAPGGTVAFYPQPSLLERIAKFFSSSADAALSGLSNVADGTVVELVRIDDAGNTLSVVATTTVSNGTYFFDLTRLSVSFSSNLVAQVRNQATGARMRAFVTSETVNIDPISEALVRAVLEKIVAIAGTLNAFTVKELVDLTSGIDFLTTIKQATVGADLETTVTTIKNLLAADPSLTAFLTAAAAPGQTTEAPGDVGDYFPVTNGNRWEATVTGWGTGQSTTTHTDITQITGTRVFNGVSTLVFQESDPSRGILGEDYRTKTSAGITYYGNNDASDTITPLFAPYSEMKFPLQAGSSFEQMNRAGLDYGVDYDGDGIHETYSVYSVVTFVGFQTVGVDAGTFHNCATFQTTLRMIVAPSRYPILQITLTSTLTESYASGVGLVRKHLETTSTSYLYPSLSEYYYEDYVLVAYNADGHHDGPQVMSTQPVNPVPSGADYTISATFNRELDPSSINTVTFTLKDSGNNPVAGTVFPRSSYYPNDKPTFTPSMPLIPGTYTATISTGVKDKAGKPLDSPYSWTFTIGTSLFLHYLSLPTGSRPSAVAIGDVNGDGRNDLVMVTGYNVSPDDYKLFVFLQNAAGTLEMPTKYSVGGTYPETPYVAIGDVNNDGRNDVVVGKWAGLEVFLQDASGGLSPGITYASTDAGSIKIIDINNDGFLDIVGAGQSSVSIWFQAPNGTLDSPATYTVGYAADLDVADLNNDGLLDIVVLNAPRIGVLSQKADGTFNLPVFYDIPKVWDTYGYIAAGDVNGDGLSDVVALYDAYPPKLGVFLQNAAGGLNSAVAHPLTWTAQPVKIADLNNDGRNDVAMLHGGCSLGVFLQAADGTLGAEQMYNCTGGESRDYSQALAIGDINGDGLEDIVAASLGGLWIFYHSPPASGIAELTPH